ncbi:MAG: flagellar basal body L-ring protein FlgH [Gemmatimonadota bacterium]
MTGSRTWIAGILLGTALGAGAADAQTRQSWTSDRRDFAAGDVITVLIDEYTLAASNQGDFNSERRFNDLSIGAGQSVTSAIPNVGAEVRTGNQGETRSQSDATRQNRFQGEMTVRVLSIEEGGLLRVEGRKVVNIDRTTEELVLRGLVRPNDVSASNMVESWRIGDAELVYTSERPSARGGIFGRILGIIWP